MQPPISLLLLLTGVVSALNLNVDNVDSISSAAKTVVSTIMSIYDAKNGSQIPGLFPAPYYWWESGLGMLLTGKSLCVLLRHANA
jgi:mannan endo-1,6-alpha-mannosidase